MLDQHTNSTFRLINSIDLSAKENMAIDKAIFSSFTDTSTPIFRVYDWQHSFTIGLSQKIDTYENENWFSSYDNNYAKRITGGGVLFHGHDISYSLMLPVSAFDTLNVKESYEKICTFLLHFYNSLGLKSMYAKDDVNTTLSKSDFCQIGFEAYDILVNNIKMGGNAQRRSKKYIFQHGSIPLYKTNIKEVGYSLEELGINLTVEKAKELLIQSFQNTFNVNFEKSILNKEEKESFTKIYSI